MTDRDLNKYMPDEALLERLKDRKRADAEIEAIRGDEILQREVAAMRAEGTIPPMVVEKGEAMHTRYTPKPMVAGSVPEEGAPKVRVPIKADTDQFGREELEKLRTPEGPAPLVAHEGTEKPSDKPTDPRLGETNVVRRNKKYTAEQQANARKEADAIFATHAPGSDEFMKGVALCHAFDLKLPVVDLDEVQALANEAVRGALTEAQKGPARGATALREADEVEDVAPPPKRFTSKQIAVGLLALVLLLPAVIYLGIRLGRPEGPEQPLTVAPPNVPTTAVQLVTNTVAPLPTAVQSLTVHATETATPRPSVTAASTSVSPPNATARPSVSAVGTARTSAPVSTQATAPTANSTQTAVPPEWD